MASVTGNIPHKTVLKREVIEYLALKPGGLYIDATFGAGGHTRAILDAEPTAQVIAFDWDLNSVEQYVPPLQALYGDRLRIVWSNFSQLYMHLKKMRVMHVDGILADFGTSQMQLASRPGFSFNTDTPLDMRMSPAHQAVTAAQVVNTASEEKLIEIFRQLGEERHARAIARAIIVQRAEKKIITTHMLAALVMRVVPREQGPRRIHPATKVFQALRMYVNHELDNITAFLAAALRVISPGGRVVCISFHSLEDRIVKDTFRQEEEAQHGMIITKRVVVPTDEEINLNSSSRSAKLRVFQRAGG